MKNKLQDIKRFVWETDLQKETVFTRFLIKVVRILYVVAHDMSDGQLTLRAMSLVYTTLLSMVPLIAVSFSVLKGFGVHNQVEPMLLNVLAPLGDKGVEITQNIIGFVENIKVGVLGSLGLFLLLYTVVALIQKIERSFNYTWHVTQNRPLAQRFSDYLSVVLVGPVLIFTALGITATVSGADVVKDLSTIEPLGHLIAFVSKLAPYLLVIVAFTFLYTFVPNAKVKIRSALVGAVVAGVMWETTGWIFASFVVNSAKYAAIYSAFATLIMFMIWLYVSWLILLVGASIAFYHQHPEYLTSQERELHISNRLKEQVSLEIMFLVADSFYHSKSPWSIDSLSIKLRMPMDKMQRLVQALVQGGLLKATDDSPSSYMPTHPLERITIKQILETARSAEESQALNPERIYSSSSIVELVGYMDKSMGDSLAGRTLQDLITDQLHS